jgi:hypothetical protein
MITKKIDSKEEEVAEPTALLDQLRIAEFIATKPREHRARASLDQSLGN